LAKSVKGAGILLRDLRKLTPAVAEEILLNGLEVGAMPTRNRWRQLAPYKTGMYRRSIQIVREQHRIVIGTDIVKPPYPFWLEFGTKRMPKGKPSARPAIDQTEETVKANTRKAVRQQLEKMLPGNKL